jgi:hypothetical protein
LTVPLFTLGLILIEILLAFRQQRVDQSCQFVGAGGDGARLSMRAQRLEQICPAFPAVGIQEV